RSPELGVITAGDDFDLLDKVEVQPAAERRSSSIVDRVERNGGNVDAVDDVAVFSRGSACERNAHCIVTGSGCDVGNAFKVAADRHVLGEFLANGRTDLGGADVNGWRFFGDRVCLRRDSLRLNRNVYLDLLISEDLYVGAFHFYVGKVEAQHIN